jgi:hypothetical protein
MADPEGNEFCIVLKPSKVQQWCTDPDEVVVRNERQIAGTD